MQLVLLLVFVWICQGLSANQTVHKNGKLITSICSCLADLSQSPQNGCKIAVDDTLTLNAMQYDKVSTKLTLLLNVDDNSCADTNRTQNFIPESPKSSQVWLYGIISVAVISSASALGVFCIPLCRKSCYQGFLTLFMGLAVGSLLGSALFHLIPQALGLADRDNKSSYLKEMAMVMTGTWVFFIVDRILKLRSVPVNTTTSAINLQTISTPVEHSPLCPTDQQCNGEKIIDRETNNNKNVKMKRSKITPLSWMIILGDAIHNFIDGLTIGAAYNNSLASGISLTVAVFCEEAPHELGDLAVLLNSGMSLKRAVMFNLISALTSFIGLAIGILITPIDTDSYIFAFAGGMFLYISLGAMLREMNEISEEANKISRLKSTYVLVLQNIGLIIGSVLLYTLALFQDDINVVIFL